MDRRKKEIAPPCVYLEWEDASTLGGLHWNTLEELKAEARDHQYINQTVGWIIEETPGYVLLSAQIAVDEEKKAHEYDLSMRIPKSLIRRKVVLSLGGKK